MTSSSPRPYRFPSRLARLARGLVSLLALAAVLVVLPLVLAYTAGNPLPGHLPSLDQVRDALARPASDDTLILLVVRDLAWLLWAAFCASTLVEVTAHAHGRAAPRLPGLGSVQHLARSLITGVTLMTSAPPAAALATAASPPAATAPAVAADLDAHTPTAGTAPGHHTVHKGDTLWEIAERSLGDGQRWREIAALNHISDPGALQPGTALTLPAQHVQPSPTSGPGAGSGPGPHSTNPPASRPTPASLPVSPMPNTTFSASVAPLSPAFDAPAAAPLQPPSHTHHDGAVSWGPLTAVFASGMLAGGVLTKIAQLRHMQRQNRRRGRRIRLSHLPHARRVEQRLAWEAQTAAMDQEAGRLLRVTLRALAYGLRQANLHPPEIVGVHVAGDTVEVLLARPSRVVPEYFAVRPGSNDMCWRLTPDGRQRLLSDDTADTVDDQGSDPLPGLISVSRTGSGGQLLVNVEALGVVGCRGKPQLVETILCTIATEVSTNPWADWFDAVLVGFDELAAIEGRVQSCNDLDQALQHLAWRAEVIRRRLDSATRAGSGDARSLRLLGDDLSLTLVVSRIPPNREQLRQLLAIVDGTGGVAAVLPAATHTEFPALFALETDQQHAPVLHIEPLHLTVTPQPLTSDDYDAIVSVLTAAADTRDVAADQPPYGTRAHDIGAASASDTEEEFCATATEPSGTTDHTGPAQEDEDRRGNAPSGETNLLRLRPRTGSKPGGPPSPWTGTMNLSPAPPGSAALTGAKNNDVSVASESRVSPITPTVSTHRHDEPAEDEQSASLSIGVLGPLEVTGARQDLQPKQLEIVLLLALNSPAGLRNDQLRTLLGPDPDHPRGSDSFRQAITRTRRRLGPAADGTERIVHVGDGIYRLHDAELDWTRFQTLVEEATSHASDAASKLRQALQLVRGRPLEGCYHWWIDTPLLETMRATIVDAAELLAELDLAAGAITGTGRAARIGLIADPAAEQLWRMVMRAEHGAGNTAGVHEAWSGCLRELAAVDTDLEPHPDTVELYHHLTHRPTTAAYGH